MKNISLHGSYYKNNYGDVLIQAIEAKWIREITNGEINLPFATDIYREQLNAEQERGSKAISSSDYLFYGAGGFLGEPSDSIKWSIRFLQRHVKSAFLAKKNGIKYSVVGTGVGPISNNLVRKALLYIVNNAEKIGVRDEESKNYLVEYGVNEDKVMVTADVALSLTKEDISSKYKEKIISDFAFNNKISFGVHIGADRFDNTNGKKVQSIIDESISFIERHPEVEPVLIIDNANKTQTEAVNYINENLSTKCKVYTHNDYLETTALLSELDMVVTNKLHVGIVNYALGNVPISFPYHPKTKRFYKQIGLERLCTPIRSVNNANVYETLEGVLKDIKLNQKKKYHNNHDKVYKLALKNKEIMKEVLN